MTDEELNNFLVKNFGKYFNSTKEKLYSKLNEEKSLRKFVKWLYIFLTTPDEVEKCVRSNPCDNCVRRYNVEILNIFDPELKLINTKPTIKSKLKYLLSELKSLKFRQYLFL